jgi:hypothetical protein
MGRVSTVSSGKKKFVVFTSRQPFSTVAGSMVIKADMCTVWLYIHQPAETSAKTKHEQSENDDPNVLATLTLVRFEPLTARQLVVDLLLQQHAKHGEMIGAE